MQGLEEDAGPSTWERFSKKFKVRFLSMSADHPHDLTPLMALRKSRSYLSEPVSPPSPSSAPAGLCAAAIPPPSTAGSEPASSSKV